MTGRPLGEATDAVGVATRALAAFGRLELRLGGTSMLPALRPGDVVEFRTLDSSGAKPGEIVLFRRGSALVAHRVVALTDQGLLTQGDSLDAPDPLVPGADVLGRGVGLIRRGRNLHWSLSRRPSAFTRWCFRRFDLATRMWLRWQRITARAAA